MSKVAVVGAGVIGIGWAKLFARGGWAVALADPRPDLAQIIDDQLGGLAVTGFAEAGMAADGADYVQEAGPERIDFKHKIFAELAGVTGDDVVLASSSSSLLPSQIAHGSPAAARILIGHPFNPADLMPLVEVVPGSETSDTAMDRAMQVYRELGKTPIRLKSEIPGFVGNRLQKVFNDQAMYLVQQGVIAAKDLDDLVTASLGLRWATIGPFEGMNLGGGPAGIRHLMENVGSQMTFEIGSPDPTKIGAVVAQVDAAYGTGEQNYERAVQARDSDTRKILDALGKG
ncbi:3-hydroxyacyl-CoA dehydrogenase NAD-binding domain-containing protein [Nocardia salmonicida]|uniref:3-hydroxyacyl-CoA dehydrogenase NAD-binding domain-containing protein n=1 Tax=Nocardia salmonicida TaxID=53431 RepID=UPI002E2CF6D7|nr:3-hydroxyacyl-CoA dehydrogenase NAD-binding domain-containing protein [Nocardia salmonicida]